MRFEMRKKCRGVDNGVWSGQGLIRADNEAIFGVVQRPIHKINPEELGLPRPGGNSG